MKNLLIVLMCLFFVACSRDDAIRMLEAEGYENVQITNFGWLRCRENISEKTSFIAQRDGKEVDGSICLPYLYRYTVTRIRRGEEVFDDEMDNEEIVSNEPVDEEELTEETGEELSRSINNG